MSYGETRSVTETFATLGVRFPFQREDVAQAKRGFDKLLGSVL